MGSLSEAIRRAIRNMRFSFIICICIAFMTANARRPGFDQSNTQLQENIKKAENGGSGFDYGSFGDYDGNFDSSYGFDSNYNAGSFEYDFAAATGGDERGR